MTDTTREAQDFQAIGQASPELDQVAAEKKGWQGHDGEPLIDARVDHDFSRYNVRANRQAIGFGDMHPIPNIAGHVETPAAAQPVTPFDPYREEL